METNVSIAMDQPDTSHEERRRLSSLLHKATQQHARMRTVWSHASSPSAGSPVASANPGPPRLFQPVQMRVGLLPSLAASSNNHHASPAVQNPLVNASLQSPTRPIASNFFRPLPSPASLQAPNNRYSNRTSTSANLIRPPRLTPLDLVVHGSAVGGPAASRYSAPALDAAFLSPVSTHAPSPAPGHHVHGLGDTHSSLPSSEFNAIIQRHESAGSDASPEMENQGELVSPTSRLPSLVLSRERLR